MNVCASNGTNQTSEVVQDFKSRRLIDCLFGAELFAERNGIQIASPITEPRGNSNQICTCEHAYVMRQSDLLRL